MKDYKHTLPIGAKLQSPKRIYTVEQVLGQGGFGITYKVSANIKVENVTVRTFFAVKEFFMSDSCERSNNSVCYSSPVKDKVEEGKADFFAEAQRLNKISLNHSNIIHVNEVFEANNTVYYVMEYLDGGSLRSYVHKNGVLLEKQALDFMLPIMKAADVLHQNKMTHLDIKPDNIMLKHDADSNKVVPVLIDFGLAKHYDEKGKPTSRIRNLGCSDGYAPIEQYTGIYTFTPQADVYALAATLLYLLIGKDPVTASDISKENVLNSLPNNVSIKVKNAIVAAMKMRKEERTSTVANFLDSLVNSCRTQNRVKTRPLQNPKVPEQKVKISGVKYKKQYLAILLIVLGLLALIVIYQSVPIKTENEEDPNLLQAIEQKNIGLLRSFAEKDSVRAYFPLAKLYYSIGKNDSAYFFANKTLESFKQTRRDTLEISQFIASIANKAQSIKPSALSPSKEEKVSETKVDVIDVVEPQKGTEQSNDDKFDKAVASNDVSTLRQLANKGYVKAYSKLAKIYMSQNNYSSADAYARQALRSNIGKSEASKVIEALDLLGYYDNGEHGGKPLN